MPTAQQTELEAINSILSAAREDSVTALGTVDSEQAELILDEVNRGIQARGWFWNKRKRTFAESGGKIPIGDEILEVDTGRRDTRYAIRYESSTRRLFDLVNDTFDFTNSITLEAIELLSWNDLPHTAQNAMQTKAAQLYVERIAGDMQTADRAARTAQMAWAELMRSEIQVANARNFGRDARRAIDRVHPLDRIR